MELFRMIKEIANDSKGLAICLSFIIIAYSLAFVCAALELLINIIKHE